MRILVSGAGVAGLSAGIDLAAIGHDVTIIERATHLRVNGSPIDIRGESIGVAEKMGLLDQIRAQRVDMSERVEFVDSAGITQAELHNDEIGDSAGDIEIPREDLMDILRDALSPATPLVFGESIAQLLVDDHGVSVRLGSGAQDRYDLVVGADGLHSTTRRLVFGPESDFLHHLGFYTALADLPDYALPDRRNPMYQFPGHLVGIAAYRNKTQAVFIFRSPWIEYDYRDLDAQKQILVNAFGGHHQWKVPELLTAAQQDPQLYFDSVSQIHMPAWHQGRVVLVGDAAYCASPLSGRGTSLALTGAWSLAEALREHPRDLQHALHQYERDQRPRATTAQATAGPGGDRLVPPDLHVQ